MVKGLVVFTNYLFTLNKTPSTDHETVLEFDNLSSKSASYHYMYIPGMWSRLVLDSFVR